MIAPLPDYSMGDVFRKYGDNSLGIVGSIITAFAVLMGMMFSRRKAVSEDQGSLQDEIYDERRETALLRCCCYTTLTYIITVAFRQVSDSGSSPRGLSDLRRLFLAYHAGICSEK